MMKYYYLYLLDGVCSSLLFATACKYVTSEYYAQDSIVSILILTAFFIASNSVFFAIVNIGRKYDIDKALFFGNRFGGFVIGMAVFIILGSVFKFIDIADFLDIFSMAVLLLIFILLNTLFRTVLFLIFRKKKEVEDKDKV